MKSTLSKKIAILCTGIFVSAAVLTGCSKKNTNTAQSIAVFIPGIMADSPIYANLAKGVQTAVDEYNKSLPKEEQATMTVLEAGTNQAEWSGKLTELASSGSYNVIISSNPSMPELCAPLTEQFPTVKYILLNAESKDNKNIFAVNYSQKEQAYLSGYIAGLMSKTHKVGLITAQEYPDMNNIILPYYTKGASDAYEGTTTDFRIVGNWYDASKGAELTDALCDSGVDVILPICGGAVQGVISSAREHKIHLNWFDENGFSKAPGVIISSCMVKQDVAAKEVTLDYLNGKTPWGTTKDAGFADGYIDFIDTDPLYKTYVPEPIQEKLSALVKGYKNESAVVPELQ